MKKIEKIPTKKTPQKPHYIREWMEVKGVRAVDLSRATGIDKSNISRWLKYGSCPAEEQQQKLGDFFKCGRDGLFHHPDDHRLRALLEGRSPDEVDRIFATIEMAFPREKR